MGFDESGSDGHLYHMVNEIIRKISVFKENFYSTIFSPEYEILDIGEQNFILDVVLTEFGLSFREFVEIAVEERFADVS
jgi:hypothetical protein